MTKLIIGESKLNEDQVRFWLTDHKPGEILLMAQAGQDREQIILRIKDSGSIHPLQLDSKNHLMTFFQNSHPMKGI